MIFHVISKTSITAWNVKNIIKLLPETEMCQIMFNKSMFRLKWKCNVFKRNSLETNKRKVWSSIITVITSQRGLNLLYKLVKLLANSISFAWFNNFFFPRVLNSFFTNHSVLPPEITSCSSKPHVVWSSAWNIPFLSLDTVMITAFFWDTDHLQYYDWVLLIDKRTPPTLKATLLSIL